MIGLYTILVMQATPPVLTPTMEQVKKRVFESCPCTDKKKIIIEPGKWYHIGM